MNTGGGSNKNGQSTHDICWRSAGVGGMRSVRYNHDACVRNAHDGGKRIAQFILDFYGMRVHREAKETCKIKGKGAHNDNEKSTSSTRCA